MTRPLGQPLIFLQPLEGDGEPCSRRILDILLALKNEDSYRAQPVGSG